MLAMEKQAEFVFYVHPMRVIVRYAPCGLSSNNIPTPPISGHVKSSEG